MLVPPPGLDDRSVTASLRTAWSHAPSGLVYAPVGFGSHHWIADDYFITVDDVADAGDLEAALRTTCALRQDAGLDFVVAPIPADDGSLVVPLAEKWVMHVYERLDIVDNPMFGPHEDPEVLELVQAIHDATDIVGHHAHREDFSIWERADLEEALANLDKPWDTGPYGEPARRVLAANASDVASLLATHDQLAADVDDQQWVVTHGEPHRGNIFRTTRGWAVVDWDTVLVAPPARDFWDLPGDRGDPLLAKLYRLRWDLTEVAVYVAGFYSEHSGDANDDGSWEGLLEYIDLRRRWPDLL